jgi:hypothetical protein
MGWLMNWKGLGREAVVLSQHVPGDTEKCEKPVRIAGALAEIRTDPLENASPEYYRLARLFGKESLVSTFR